MLFDRRQVLGYFQAIPRDKKATNDFLLFNVHLASEQEIDENHLIAMALIGYELQRKLEQYSIDPKKRRHLWPERPTYFESTNAKLKRIAKEYGSGENAKPDGLGIFTAPDLRQANPGFTQSYGEYQTVRDSNPNVDRVIHSSGLKEHVSEKHAILRRNRRFDCESSC